MNFFCDSGGNIFHVDSEKVYQGSVNANKIYFIGAFPSFCEVTARFQLPNGTFTEPQLLTKVNLETLTEIQGKNGENFNVWYCLLNQIITQYYGIVSMQFNVIGTKNIVLATANSSFEILRGVPTIIDETNIEIETFTSEVLSYIASVKEIVTAYDETITASEEKFEQTLTSLNVAKKEVDEATKQLVEGLTDYVKKDQFAESEAGKGGLVRGFAAQYGLGQNAGANSVYIIQATEKDIANKVQQHNPIVPANLDLAVKTSVTTNTIDLSDDEKTSACEWLGAVKKLDIASGEFILTQKADGSTDKLAFNESPVAYTIVRRDSGGKFYSAPPSDTDEGAVANAKWCRDNFVGKTTNTQPVWKLYGAEFGNDTADKMYFGFPDNGNYNWVAFYNNDICLYTSDPKKETDAVNLRYFNNNIPTIYTDADENNITKKLRIYTDTFGYLHIDTK